MASEDIECITLDDSDEEGPSPSVFQYGQQFAAGALHGVLPLAGRPAPALPRYDSPQMVRCNLCVDPGLLPVETDRAKHR